MAHKVPHKIRPLHRGEKDSMDTPLLASSLTSPSSDGGVARGEEGGATHSSGEGASSSSSPKTCRRCGQSFSIFFNKRVTCGGCSLAVCRKCAPWSTAHKAYVCGECSKPSPTRGDGSTATDEAKLKEVEASVRSHIEALVENQIGGPLDHVTAEANVSTHHPQLDFNRISEDNKWDLLLYYYCYCHGEQELHTDRPLPPEDLPTSRHAQLSEHVSQALKDAMILPAQVEGYDPAASPETPVEDFNSHTYEDILATAILNKVLESCEGERPDEVTIEVSHEVTSTDTDSGMSGGVKESRRRRGKRSEVSEAGSECSEERSLTPQRSRTPPVSPDQGVVTDDSWAQAASGDGPPLQFKIEEHVEEITTHHLTDDEQDLEGFDEEDVSDSGGSWRGSRCSLEDSKGRPQRREKVSHHTAVAEDGFLSTLNIPLPDPSFAAARRVSFPELGADIIQDSCLDTECCAVGPGDMVVEADTWEQNWLFRRQKLVGGGAPDAVTMLIPNPESHVPATVGNRDVDELSELSERQSLGSGEPWSTSDSDGEFDPRGDIYHTYTASRELSALAGEIVAEFAQQDQEYTVDYSVPSRVTAARSPEPNKPVRSKPPISNQSRSQGQATNYNQIAKGYTNSRGVDGVKNPAAIESGVPHLDADHRYDAERPVPKPRKLSLSPTSKTSVKSPVHLLPSPSEDHSILSPPLDVPNPKNTSSKSHTVWFVGDPEDCTVSQGRTLRLVCQVNTKKPMGLSWYFNGSLVSMNGRDMWAWRKGSYHHLHVYSMSPSKVGIYAAAAYTASDCVWAFCQVQQKASSRPQKRPAFSKGLPDVTLEEGSELQLQCQVTGHPEPRVVFSRGSEKISPSPRVSIESDQYGTWTIRVSECKMSDSGEISATATNPIAALSSRCQVRVVPEGTVIPQNQGPVESRNAVSSVSKQRDPHSTSSNRHKSGKHGKHDSKLHNTGSSPSHQSNSSWSTQNNIHLLTTANTDNSFTMPAGVIIDADDIDDIQQVPTKPGTIAEREHRKWEAAVPLPNNPYAPERLVHRLSHSRNSTQTTITGRGIKVDLTENGERELDPSLRDGVPPQADLNRYSRDYYISSHLNSRNSHNIPIMKNQHKMQQQIYHQTEQQQPHTVSLSNGIQDIPEDSSELLKNQVHIQIIGRGSQGCINTGGITVSTPNRLEKGTEVETSRPSDWKDELKDIQAARVEREVARFQRTIDETQRRWEANYARHAPRGPSNIQSDSSEILHNPPADLVPPRHDLWRTVSVDTINSPPKEKVYLEPLQRHTSVDNLRLTKVSNLRNLGSADQRHMSSVNTVSSISSININSMNKMSSYQHKPQHRQSVESMSGYSDGESHGDGNESDVSTRTHDETPILPSVKKLASKFDLASQERVNDLDKHETDGTLTFNGKKNIFLIDKSPSIEHPYSRNFTNNLNKRTEKPFTIKEVRSLPNKPSTNYRHTSPTSDNDTHVSDLDDSEFDDRATVTSISLPPTPHTLDGRLSLSTSSLLDSDSCFSPDYRDNKILSADGAHPKTFFGVTLRKVTPSISSRRGSQNRASVSSFSSVEGEYNLYRNGFPRCLSSTGSLADVNRGITPGYTDSDSETPSALRQVTIIKVQDKAKPQYQSLTNLSLKDTDYITNQKQYSSTLDVIASPVSSAAVFNNVNKPSWSSSNLSTKHRRESLPSAPVTRNKRENVPVSTASSISFGQKGKRRSMHEFLNRYRRQMSMHEINRIDEKVEEDLNNQKQGSFIGHYRAPHSGGPKSSLKKSPMHKSLGNIEAFLSVSDQLSSRFSMEQPSIVIQNTEEKVLAVPTNIAAESSHYSGVSSSAQFQNSDSETSSISEELAITGPHNVTASGEKLPSEKHEIIEVKDADHVQHIDRIEDDHYLPQKQSENDNYLSQKQNVAPVESVSLTTHGLSAVNKNPTKTTQKRTSMSNFLKQYSNIHSLAEKSSFNVPSNTAHDTNEDENKTVIIISDNKSQSTSVSNVSKLQVSHKPLVNHPKPRVRKPVQDINAVKRPQKIEIIKSGSQENTGVTKVSSPANLDKGTDHETIITLPGEAVSPNKDGSLFHASIVYVGDEDVNQTGKNNNLKSKESQVNGTFIPDSTDHMFGDTHSKGSHVTVISVEEPLRTSSMSPASNTASSLSEHLSVNSEEEFDPIAITKRIVASSRMGSSDALFRMKRANLENASIPINSPFSPVSKRNSSSPERFFQYSSRDSSSLSLTENVSSTKNLGSQDLNDEGVDLTLSDADLAPSATSTESKSTSSLDNIGKEGSETMVLCH